MKYNYIVAGSGFFGTVFAQQAKECKKTVLIQLAKMLPLSIELQRAISIDETSRDYRRGSCQILDWDEKGVCDPARQAS